MNLTRIKAGEKFVPREGAYNAFCDAAEANRLRTGGGPIEGREDGPRLVVRVKNNTGAQIKFGACVMLDEVPITLPIYTGEGYELNANTAFSAVFRSATVTTMFPQRFAVALEPIPDGDIGPVCIRGACVALSTNPTSGWLLPTFTASSSTFTATTKRTGVQVLHATSDGFTVVFLDNPPWQIRRSNAACPTEVTSASRGSSFGFAGTTDGFSETKTVTFGLAGTWENVIATSIIKVPCNGIYDFRYSVHAKMLLNSGIGEVLNSSQFPINIRNMRVMARISLVDASTGAYMAGMLYPNGVLDYAGLMNIPIYFESGGGAAIAYSGQFNGSATMEIRHTLTSSLSLAVGIVMTVISGGIGSYTIPGMTLNVQGTGIIRPAEQDIYVAPPVP